MADNRRTISKLLHLTSPWALRGYAGYNIVCAIVFGSMAWSKILELMYLPSRPQAVTFDQMILLLDRSLMHSFLAGIAFIGSAALVQFRDVNALKTPGIVEKLLAQFKQVEKT